MLSVESVHHQLSFCAFAVIVFAICSAANAQQSESINICENVANNIFLTDVNNCSNYYICVNGKPIHQTCENNRFFNGKTQSCEVSNTSCLQCGQNELSLTALPRTCDKYIMCFAGALQVRQCADNLQFNQDTNHCDLASNVDCVANHCALQNNPNDIVYIPSAAACDKYYICLSGTPVNQTCSKGLQFSTACNCCNLASIVGCKITPVSRRTALTHVSPPERVNLDCPKTGIHFYAHESRDRYYVCSEGQGAILTCAEGLFYDPKVQECRQLKQI